MGGTVLDPAQDRFCDCVGQQYSGTRDYRTSVALSPVRSLRGISVPSDKQRTFSTFSPVRVV